MKITLLFLSLIAAINSFGQDATQLINEGYRLENSMHDADALNKYKEALHLQPTNIKAICRCSELCSRLANRLTNKKIRDDYYLAAKTYAETALKLDARSADANFVMSVVMGRLALTKSGKDKISAAKDIKKYADLAIKYDPNNYKAWHVLGKWYYEVSSLNGFERIGVKLFFGGMPKATLVDAIKSYERSLELAPHFLLNYLELARVYKKNNQEDEAIALLKIIPSIPNTTEDDPSIREHANKMLLNLL